MRRTTISRSRSTILLAALPGLLAAPAAPAMAQGDSAAVQDPGSRVHVVSEGETLWGLAQTYFGDPFLWPQIYRLNTVVVEDPHWIFPGEVLSLDELFQGEMGEPEAAEREMEVPEEAPPPPPPPSETTPTVFTPRRRDAGVSERVREGVGRRTPTVVSGQFYSAGFLTEGQALPWGKVLGAVGRSRLDRVAAAASARQFEQINIEAPSSGAYRVGDTLLVAELGREVEGWGEVVRPSGIARVVHAAGGRGRAEVIQLFASVADGQVLLPLEPFRDPGMAQAQPVEDGMTGRIIQLRELHLLPNRQHIVFIDHGRSDGVALGDEFEVLGRASETVSGAPRKVMGVLRIVHVRERSASGMLIQVFSEGIGEGGPIRLVRKMPS